MALPRCRGGSDVNKAISSLFYFACACNPNLPIAPAPHYACTLLSLFLSHPLTITRSCIAHTLGLAFSNPNLFFPSFSQRLLSAYLTHLQEVESTSSTGLRNALHYRTFLDPESTAFLDCETVRLTVPHSTPATPTSLRYRGGRESRISSRRVSSRLSQRWLVERLAGSCVSRKLHSNLSNANWRQDSRRFSGIIMS